MMRQSINCRFTQQANAVSGLVRHADGTNSMKNARGITLVELMVAITLSLVILAVMSQIFVSSRATYTVEEGLSRVQEGGRFSLDMLAYEIRQAGFYGCGNFPPGTPSAISNGIASPSQATTYDATAQAGVQGFRYVGTTGTALATDWSPSLSSSNYFQAGDIRAGSDVLIVKYATSDGVKLQNAATNGDLAILATDALGFSVNDALMATNCDRADIFIVTGITGSGATRTIEHRTPANSANTFDPTSLYGNGNELLRFFAYAYYVGNTGRTDKNGRPIPALFRNTVNSAGNRQREELIEGVEAMQIYYGVLPVGGNKVVDPANRYVPANQISTDLTVSPNWSQVSSVRVGLVVGTAEGTSRDSENTAAAGLNVLGVTTDSSAPYLDNYIPPNANDGRSRRVFSFVVNRRQPLR